MAKNRVHKGDFQKLSTGEFPVFTGPVPPLGHGPYIVKIRLPSWARIRPVTSLHRAVFLHLVYRSVLIDVCSEAL